MQIANNAIAVRGFLGAMPSARSNADGRRGESTDKQQQVALPGAQIYRFHHS